MTFVHRKGLLSAGAWKEDLVVRDTDPGEEGQFDYKDPTKRVRATAAKRQDEKKKGELFLKWLSQQSDETKKFFIWVRDKATPKEKKALREIAKKQAAAQRERYKDLFAQSPNAVWARAEKENWPRERLDDGTWAVYTPWGELIRDPASRSKMPGKEVYKPRSSSLDRVDIPESWDFRNGKWYDANNRVIGYAKAEDSRITWADGFDPRPFLKPKKASKSSSTSSRRRENAEDWKLGTPRRPAGAGAPKRPTANRKAPPEPEKPTQAERPDVPDAAKESSEVFLKWLAGQPKSVKDFFTWINTKATAQDKKNMATIAAERIAATRKKYETQIKNNPARALEVAVAENWPRVVNSDGSISIVTPWGWFIKVPRNKTSIRASINTSTTENQMSVSRTTQQSTRALTAARWNPDLHPRGRDGRFIEVFGWVRAFVDILNGPDGDNGNGGGHRRQIVGQVQEIIPNPDKPGHPTIRVKQGEGAAARIFDLDADNIEQAEAHIARLDDAAEKVANAIEDVDVPNIPSDLVPGEISPEADIPDITPGDINPDVSRNDVQIALAEKINAEDPDGYSAAMEAVEAGQYGNPDIMSDAKYARSTVREYEKTRPDDVASWGAAIENELGAPDSERVYTPSAVSQVKTEDIASPEMTDADLLNQIYAEDADGFARAQDLVDTGKYGNLAEMGEADYDAATLKAYETEIDPERVSALRGESAQDSGLEEFIQQMDEDTAAVYDQADQDAFDMENSPEFQAYMDEESRLQQEAYDAEFNDRRQQDLAELADASYEYETDDLELAKEDFVADLGQDLAVDSEVGALSLTDDGFIIDEFGEKTGRYDVTQTDGNTAFSVRPLNRDMESRDAKLVEATQWNYGYETDDETVAKSSFAADLTSEAGSLNDENGLSLGDDGVIYDGDEAVGKYEMSKTDTGYSFGVAPLDGTDESSSVPTADDFEAAPTDAEQQDFMDSINAEMDDRSAAAERFMSAMEDSTDDAEWASGLSDSQLDSLIEDFNTAVGTDKFVPPEMEDFWSYLVDEKDSRSFNPDTASDVTYSAPDTPSNESVSSPEGGAAPDFETTSARYLDELGSDYDKDKVVIKEDEVIAVDEETAEHYRDAVDVLENVYEYMTDRPSETDGYSELRDDINALIDSYHQPDFGSDPRDDDSLLQDFDEIADRLDVVADIIGEYDGDLAADFSSDTDEIRAFANSIRAKDLDAINAPSEVNNKATTDAPAGPGRGATNLPEDEIPNALKEPYVANFDEWKSDALTALDNAENNEDVVDSRKASIVLDSLVDDFFAQLRNDDIGGYEEENNADLLDERFNTALDEFRDYAENYMRESRLEEQYPGNYEDDLTALDRIVETIRNEYNTSTSDFVPEYKPYHEIYDVEEAVKDPRWQAAIAREQTARAAENVGEAVNGPETPDVTTTEVSDLVDQNVIDTHESFRSAFEESFRDLDAFSNTPLGRYADTDQVIEELLNDIDLGNDGELPENSDPLTVENADMLKEYFKDSVNTHLKGGDWYEEMENRASAGDDVVGDLLSDYDNEVDGFIADFNRRVDEVVAARSPGNDTGSASALDNWRQDAASGPDDFGRDAATRLSDDDLDSAIDELSGQINDGNLGVSGKTDLVVLKAERARRLSGADVAPESDDTGADLSDADLDKPEVPDATVDLPEDIFGTSLDGSEVKVGTKLTSIKDGFSGTVTGVSKDGKYPGYVYIEPEGGGKRKLRSLKHLKVPGSTAEGSAGPSKNSTAFSAGDIDPDVDVTGADLDKPKIKKASAFSDEVFGTALDGTEVKVGTQLTGVKDGFSGRVVGWPSDQEKYKGYVYIQDEDGNKKLRNISKLKTQGTTSTGKPEPAVNEKVPSAPSSDTTLNTPGGAGSSTNTPSATVSLATIRAQAPAQQQAAKNTAINSINEALRDSGNGNYSATDSTIRERIQNALDADFPGWRTQALDPRAVVSFKPPSGYEVGITVDEAISLLGPSGIA